jgi:hypothetical protein
MSLWPRVSTPTRTPPSHRRWRPLLVDLVLGLAVFAVACWQFLGAVDERPMHRDEARWIHRAVYVRELLDPLGPYWDEETWLARGGTLDERYRLRAQPPLGSYVMGLGFLLQGKDLPDIGFWNMDHDDAWNVAHGNQPSEEQIRTGRRTSAIVGALTVLTVYLIGRRLTNPFGGAIGALALAFHPLMIYLATFAGSDAVLGLTIVLAALAAIHLGERPTWPRAILLGVCLGLGAATKLSPLAVVAPLAFLGALAIVRAWWPRLRREETSRSDGYDRSERALGLGLLSAPLIATATLLGSYPYLWRDPIGHTKALIDYRDWGMDVQGAAWPQIAVDTRIEALRRVGIRLGVDFTSVERIGELLGRSWSAPGLELAIAVAGLLLLLAIVIREGLWSARALGAAVLVSEAAVTIYGLRVDWARYHLPLLLLTVVGIGVLAGKIGASLRSLLSRPLRSSIPKPSHQQGPLPLATPQGGGE